MKSNRISLSLVLFLNSLSARFYKISLQVTAIALTFLLSSRALAASSTSTSLQVSNTAQAAVSTIAAGTAVVLKASTLAGATPISPGLVQFCDASVNTSCTGPALLGTAQLNSTGTASLAIKLRTGAHQLQATFTGTLSYTSSTSGVSSLTVTSAGSYLSNTTINSASTSTPGTYDLSATVLGTSLPSPTGTVTLQNTSNGNAVLASSPLSSGTTGYLSSLTYCITCTLPSAISSVLSYGDFNNDGNPDLVLPAQGTLGNAATLQIALGNGDGTFQQTMSRSLGNVVVSGLVIADLNNDGKLDIAVLGNDASTNGFLSILLGNGDGTFQTPLTQNLTGDSAGMAVGDLNRDGIPDLVILNTNFYGISGTVSVLLGNGDGTFQSQVNYGAGVKPSSLVIGDFNSNGFLDIAVTNEGAGTTVSVLPGNGDGTLQSPITSPAGTGPVTLAAADFNGDGSLDLAVTTSSGVLILTGRNDYTFNTSVTYTISNPLTVTTADINNDGKLDFVALNATSLLVALGNGDGSFQTPWSLPSPSAFSFTALTAADVNGDGKVDITTGFGQRSTAASTSAALFLNSSGPSVKVTAAAVFIPGSSAQLINAAYSGDSIYLASTSGTVSLQPKPLAPLTWTAPVAISYGTALSATQLNATSSIPGTFSYSPAAGAVPAAGSATLTVTFTPNDTVNYATSTKSVALTVNPAQLTATANNAVRVYGSPNPSFTGSVSGAVNGDTFTETFSTTATASTNVGSAAIVPAVSGANLNNYAVSIVNGTLTISQAGSLTTLSLSNQNKTYTAMVSPATTGTPTGSVRFMDGQTVLATATLSGGTATYTPSTLTPGTQVTAQYLGDANFTSSSSSPVAVLSLSASSASLSVGQNSSTSTTLSVSPIAGYVGTIQFSCTGLPQGASCSFQPSSVTFNGTNTATNVTITIKTGATASASLRDTSHASSGTFACILWAPANLALFLAFSRRKSALKLGSVLLPVFLLGCFGMLMACSTSSSSTPKGTSAVQVVATGTNLTAANYTINLTVQ